MFFVYQKASQKARGQVANPLVTRDLPTAQQKFRDRLSTVIKQEGACGFFLLAEINIEGTKDVERGPGPEYHWPGIRAVISLLDDHRHNTRPGDPPG